MAQSAIQASPEKTGKSPAKAPKQSSKTISISSPKTFQDFTVDAMVNLNDRKGLTRVSLVNYIKQNHATESDTKMINNRIKAVINKLIADEKVTRLQDDEPMNWTTSRFKLEKKFKEEIKKLKKADDQTPKKITMPKKSSAKKEKSNEETKKTKKAAAPKKAMTKSSTPKKTSKEAAPKKASKEATPKKARTTKKN